MKVTLNDENILQATTAGTGAFALGLLGAPRKFNETMIGVGPVPHAMINHTGAMALTIGAMSAVSAKADVATRKKMLKVTGAAWLTHAALDMFHVHRGHQKRDSSMVTAAAEAALGTLSLVAGFQKSIV